jgi:dextranase
MPARAFFRPGEHASISIRVSPAAVDRGQLAVELLDLDHVIDTANVVVKGLERRVALPLPPRPGRGYGVRVTLLLDGRPVDERRTALDVQISWTDAPRYGFLSQFAPEEEYPERADSMLRRHVNVVQFYDWMYRHYEYLPPEDHFVDVLGRTQSLESVRSALAAVHDRGMAAMAYGSVYGAEPEHALEHRDELLYDGPNGNPIALIDLFYLQDVRPGPWRDRVLGQYRQAVGDLGFDGIHADQYGFPREGVYDSRGELVDMPQALAGMVAAAQDAVVRAGGNGIIFNCVENWPIEEVAPEPQTCMYIEVWPPYTRLLDLYELVKGARVLAPDRQVILAAYMSCAAGTGARDNYAHWPDGWGISGAVTPDEAAAATLVTSAAIHASGGFHLLLGENDGILADPYYPKFALPGPVFRERLTAHWDFIVRYTAYLFDRDLEYRKSDSIHAGRLWAIHRSGRDFETLSLINADPAEGWNALRPEPEEKRNVHVEMPAPSTVSEVLAASPDRGGDPVRLDFEVSDGQLRFHVPSVHLWTLVIINRDGRNSKEN